MCSMAGFLLLAGSGCRNLSTNFYPIGLWGVRNTNDLDLVRGAGFNLVTGPARERWLAAADAAGLRVMAFPGTSAGPAFDARKALQAVEGFDRHPRLWAWYLSDEPDLNRVDPESLSRAYRTFKRAKARKPVAATVFHGASAWWYGEHADVMLVDRYPIPWLPLASFSQQVQLARLAVSRKKPLIAVIQAFDWSYHTNAISAPGPFRAPTYAELRCMTYGALVEGANGLFYYAFDDGRWRMSEHLGTWRDLHSVVKEVNQRRALFGGERRWWPKQHEYLEPAEAYNAALDSSIISVLISVRHGQGTCPAGEYVVAVNTTDRKIDYRFTAPWLGKRTLPVLEERRTVDVVSGWVDDVFDPFAIHVYGPAQTTDPHGSSRRKSALRQ